MQFVVRYRNAPAAIDWLCETFGFEKNLVVPADGDQIAHAQLTLGPGMVMLGSASDTEFGRLMKLSDEVDGAQTQSAYVIVDDADAVYQRAKAASASLWCLRELSENDVSHPGRGCSPE